MTLFAGLHLFFDMTLDTGCPYNVAGKLLADCFVGHVIFLAGESGAVYHGKHRYSGHW